MILLFIAGNAAAQTSSDSTTTDSTLLKQIEQDMQSGNNQPVNPPVRSSLNFNPDLSLIGDFRASYFSEGERNFDAYLNETEIGLQAVVDPYARADFFLSFARNPETHQYGVEVEEGYLTTLSLPARLQLKVGKFKEALGRINPTHSHALPFIDMPNAFVNLFGEEGLNDEGVSLSWLLPNKAFYQEIIFQATAGFSETPSFSMSNGDHFIYLAHLKNFFTLSDNTTLELGLTGINGPNDSSYTTTIAAADLTLKWKPVKLNTYHSFTWQSEFFNSHAYYSNKYAHNSWGMYSFLQYQIAKRWFLTGRFDYSEKPEDYPWPENYKIEEAAFSLTAGWYATEFQKIELEAKTTDKNDATRFYQAWLRWIFVIGAHGAHQY